MGGGRRSLDISNIGTTSGVLGVVTMITGMFPQSALDSWVSGADGYFMVIVGALFTVARVVNFKVLFGKK